MAESGLGERLWPQVIEAALGIAVGASCTAMIILHPPPSSGGAYNINGVITQPSHVCLEPVGPPRTRLDGDAIRASADGTLLCNGFTGKWETPEQRGKRMRQLRSPNKGWRGG
jgi:hypothetical protein